MSLKSKLMLLFIGFTVIPLLFFGVVVFSQARSILQSVRIAQLNNIADLKKDKIESFFEERRWDLASAQHLPVIRQALTQLGANMRHRTGAQYNRVKRDLDDRLGTFLVSQGYVDVMLTDARGNVVYESNETSTAPHLGKPLPLWKEYVTNSGGVYFTDILVNPSATGRYEMFSMAPIEDGRGAFMGAVVIEIDMDPVYRILLDTTGLGRSGEVLIARKEGENGLLLYPLQGQLKEFLRKKAVQNGEFAAPFHMAAQKNSGSGMARDYSGKEVLAAWRFIPLLRWELVTKMDAEEAFAPIEHARKLTAIIGIIVAIFGALAALSIARAVTGPVRLLQKGAEAIAAGDLYYRVGTKEKDEIGRLSRSFDAMAEALVRDRDARTMAEKKLRESVESSHAILNATSESVLLTDAEGIVVSVNETAARRLGTTVEGLLHTDIFTAVPPDVAETRKKYFLEVLQTKRHVEFQDEREGRYYEHDFYPIFDSSGEVDRITIFSRDITERKQAEDKILRLNEDLQHHIHQLQEANRELEAFSYSVSHDLRSPLRSMDGFSLALLEDYAGRLDDAGKDYLQRVRAASQRMSQLIDDLLNLSRVTRCELRRAPVNMSRVAGNIADSLKKTDPDRDVRFVIADGLMVEGDERLLKIALDNLISNAWKFTSSRRKGNIEFGKTSYDGKAAYFVKDDGVGFDMAYVAKLFGPFQRLHSSEEFPGTGIGLATVQRIINRHGGKAWIEGEVGKGATVYFTLG